MSLTVSQNANENDILNGMVADRLAEDWNIFVKERTFQYIRGADMKDWNFVRLSYEITIKNEIAEMFLDERIVLSNEECVFLLDKDNILDFLYQGWLDSDFSIQDVLRDCIKDTIQLFVCNKNEGIENG